jgi:hypothetical protein
MSAMPLRLVQPVAPALSPHVPVLLDTFDFGAPRPALSFGNGWGPPEPGGIRWCLGQRSDLTVNVAVGWKLPEGARVLAILQAAPYLAENPQAVQRLSVSLNGTTVYETARSGIGLVAFFVSPEMLDLPLAIGFEHPDALSPAAFGLFDDKRQLAFGCHRLEFWMIPPHGPSAQPVVENATPPGELMAAFESLGDNCEFGIAQRLSGCEPLGLLRFTATRFESLVDLLLHRCQGVGDPANIELDLRGTPAEYILTELRYRLTYHTFIYADQMPQARVKHRESQKLTLLARRMVEDLQSARRIYVVKRNEPLPEADVIALSLLLRTFGPNRLLYVSLADAANPAGSVRRVTDALAYGYIDALAPYDDAAQIALDAWVSICRAASALFGQDGAEC